MAVVNLSPTASPASPRQADATVEAIRRHQLFASVFSISVRPTDPLGAARLLPWAEKISIPAGEHVCGSGDGARSTRSTSSRQLLPVVKVPNS